MVNPLVVSGLPYVPDESWVKLQISPMRALIERHVGIVAEACKALSLRAVMVHGDGDPSFAFACAAFEQVGVEVSNDAFDALYVLPETLPPVPSSVPVAALQCVMKPAYEAGPCVPRHRVLRVSAAQGEAPVPFVCSVRDDVVEPFLNHFGRSIEGDTLCFNNLINLCIMVKNAGPLFRQVLAENMKYADRWTILDTGSTDETLAIIDEVLVNQYPGTLFQEPFINFRDSRNRCLDLAGKSCKYNIMLDDTYIVRGNIRSFLETVRGDEFGSSFSFYIHSDDTEYTTNRVTRTELGLRYKYKIHEVIDGDNNVNVMVPREVAYIEDLRAEYMEKRTMDRKQYDLQLLLESIEEEPECPRHLYYAAQTYNLLEDYENAVKYFRLRALDERGFLQERVDACFEWARVSQFQLKKPFSEVEPVYLKTLEIEPQKVEAMYFLGIYHIYDGRKDEDAAFPWLEKGFHVGYPVHIQYSLKPTLVYYFLPQFLAPLCYTRNKWQLGADACSRFLTNLTLPAVKKVTETHVVSKMMEWRQVYESLLKLPAKIVPVRHVDVVFVVDGNWAPWTGADIETKGLGGSETWAVEMATQFQQWLPPGQVVFFCKCLATSVYKGVEFIPIQFYESFMATHDVSVCIVSRFSHYLFAPLHTQCKQIILYLHDLGPTGAMLPLNSTLEHILCLSPWHANLVRTNFPSFSTRVSSLGYGIDTNVWKPASKLRHSFVYSSFPDRGLVHLLEMWPRIVELWPDATLRVFCNLQHQHVRRVNSAMMARIDALLEEKLPGVVVEGWVSKTALAAAYSAAEYWLYPCVFDETFCLTALEAVASGAIGIAPPKAALQHMPLVFVEGAASSTEWATKVVLTLAELDADAGRRQELVENGIQFARERSWQRQALMFRAHLHPSVDFKPVRHLFSRFPQSRREVVSRVFDVALGRIHSTVTSLASRCGIDFNYISGLIQHTPSALTNFTGRSSAAFVETPSPLIEVLRGVDPDHPDGCGYARSVFIVWTEPGDERLHVVPKLACLASFPVPDSWYEVANVYPLMWKNYLEWSGPLEASAQLCVHEVESLESYFDLIRHAATQSVVCTRSRFPAAFLPGLNDGSAVSVAPHFDVREHLEKLAQNRANVQGMKTYLEGLKKNGFEPRVIYDIGACVLEWTNAARSVWPDAEFIVFDAMGALEPLYRAAGVKYHVGLLGETDAEEVDFYENNIIPFGNSRFKEIGSTHAHELFSDAHRRIVSMRRLDAVVAERGFPLPDFVKLDVQGSELAVLQGGRETFQRASRIVVELQNVAYNAGCPPKEAVVAELTNQKFMLGNEGHVVDTSVSAMTPDYEFVRQI